MKLNEAADLEDVQREIKALVERLPSADDLADLKAAVDSICCGLKTVSRLLAISTLAQEYPCVEDLAELGPLADEFTEALVIALDRDFPNGLLNSGSKSDSGSYDKRAGCGLTAEELRQLISGMKIKTVKLLRNRTGLGLKEAKHHVESFGVDHLARSRNGR